MKSSRPWLTRNKLLNLTLGLFFLSLFLLTSCSGGKTQPAASSSTKGNEAVALPKPEEWVRAEDTDQMDGHKTISYSIRSTNSVHLTSREGPVKMALSCDKVVNTFVESGPVSSKGVRYKFDDEAPYAIGWYVLNDAVGESASKKFLSQMMKAKTFKFEFTPVGQAPQVASFELGNIRELIQNEKVCDFQKKATGY